MNRPLLKTFGQGNPGQALRATPVESAVILSATSSKDSIAVDPQPQHQSSENSSNSPSTFTRGSFSHLSFDAFCGGRGGHSSVPDSPYSNSRIHQANSPQRNRLSPPHRGAQRNGYNIAGGRQQPRTQPRFSRTTPHNGRPSDLKGSPSRPTVCRPNQHWVHDQELKIKIFGMPKAYTTRQVYEALCHHGNVVRIELAPGSFDTGAWVVFQPPPTSLGWINNVRMGSAFVRMDILQPQFKTIPSPVNLAKSYQELNILFASSIDFGVSTADSAMTTMHTVAAEHKIEVALDLNRKRVSIQFPLNVDGVVSRYRLELPITLLQHIYKAVDQNTGQCTLVIPFDFSPRFFKFDPTEEAFNVSDKAWSQWNAWYRQTDVVDNRTRDRMRTEPLMNMKGRSVIDIGRWTTYRLSFDKQAVTGPKYDEFANALADYGITIHDNVVHTLQSRCSAPMWSILQEEVSSTHPHLDPSSTASAVDTLVTDQIYLSFPIHYQLEACLSNCYLKEHTITRAFLERLSMMNADDAISILQKVMDKQMVHYDPMEIFQIRIKPKPPKKTPRDFVLVRAVNITPTMMHVASPTVEMSNRIIRKYAADSDRFIRVKFTDEKTEGRLSNQGHMSNAVFDRVARAMKEGIVVSGRYYEFLAFGNSQFRENGAYFYAPTTSRSAADIRHALGSFEHIKTAAKYGARIGQTLSTTRAITSTKIKLVEIPDIERNGFTFTDGVGKISRFLAAMAAQELGLQNAFDDPPSLYQFRLAGCKGVLALDTTVQGNVIHIRPSQYKFKATNDGLEVIRASAFATAYFNRQLIVVLSTLGVSDDKFLKKQQEWVKHLEMAMKDETLALEKLQRNVDLNQTSLTMAAMVLDGFMSAGEPFVMSLLHLWRAYNIKALKEKARIFIEDGAFLLGCVDETATLHGHFGEPQTNATREEKLAALPEIFLQISDTKKPGYYKVIEGICILARNPSLHAGDLRIVRAVDVPALHHLRNVVVLPQTGDRDLGNMCSGGDLDGDDYLVMWDAEFLPDAINEPPMDFTPEIPEEEDGPISVEKLANFFVQYMRNDSLGQIAHAHLAQADFNPDGVRDETCLELAKLHSQAVDYPKSGIKAVMSSELRPKKWPHFMDKKHLPENKTYRSTKVLGQLYDQIELVDFKPQYKNTFDNRILGAYDLDEAILLAASQIKSEYDASMARLMAKHGIRTEFEVWSIFILEHNQETRDYKFAEEFGAKVEAIKAQHREACRDAAVNMAVSMGVPTDNPLPIRTNHQDLTPPQDTAEVPGITSTMATTKGPIPLPFVAAMYTVTAREMESALEECRSTKMVGGKEVPVRKMDPENMPFISFPWLFSSELGKIAVGGGTRKRLPESSFQGAYKKASKDHTKVMDLEPGAAEIETTKGVTHYGDLLELDFGEDESQSWSRLI